MGRYQHDGLAVPGRVVLAHEPSFRLGALQVQPSTREVSANGRRQILEPRVMQVLVMLARANGEVVTRDELVDCCWDGRIVSDDAVNRVVSRIRQLAGTSSGSFLVETIARVGYRLVRCGGELDEPAVPTAPEHMPSAPRRLSTRRNVLLGAGAALGAATLGAAALLAPRGKHEPSPLAKLYYDRGLDARGQADSPQSEQAVAHFRRATEIDPNYAEAWGALAWGYRSLFAGPPRPDSERLATYARSAADRALELDPDNPDAQAALLLLASSLRRWAEVEGGCRELVARHPGHSISQYSLGFILAETGRWREAVPHFQQVAARETLWPLAKYRLFEALSCSGRLEEADAQIDEVMRLWPRQFEFWSRKVRHLLMSGRSAEALALVDDRAAEPVDERDLVKLDRLIARAYVSGSPTERRAAVDGLTAKARAEGTMAVLWAAFNCAMLGEVDPAFSMFEGFYFGRGPWAAVHDDRQPTNILFAIATASLRRDPRFPRLVEEIGLESFWRAADTQPDYRRFA